MPKDLGDVVHYFLPKEQTDSAASAGHLRAVRSRLRTEQPAALPILTIPVGDGDVVRAAFAWNLAVELARHGARVTLMAAQEAGAAAPWPAPGRGPIGAEVVHAPARSAGDLARAALDIAVTAAPDAEEGGLVIACLPSGWLLGSDDARSLLRWILLFASADARDLREAYALAKLVLAPDPSRRVGITIHGVSRIFEAQRAFERISTAAARHLSAQLLSYGLLVDDLDVYRAIVSRRPVGLEHPQSRAARALRDVARLLLEDARRAAHA